MTALRSAIYEGRVRHRRFEPVRHAFGYRLSLAYLDIGELAAADARSRLWSLVRGGSGGPLARALARFRRADYLAPHDRPLDEVARDRVAAATGHRPTGAVRLLTQLRQWGLCFNPVSFYYCFDPDAGTPGGERLAAVVAEIHNTPWNERHAYVLDLRAGERQQGVTRFRFAKDFHVSPFLPMELDCGWSLGEPGETLLVHMDDRARADTPDAALTRGGLERNGARPVVFDATMVLERRELSAGSIARHVLLHPFQSARILLAIYWQALRLRLKGAPFFAHPRTRSREALDSIPGETS